VPIRSNALQLSFPRLFAMAAVSRWLRSHRSSATQTPDVIKLGSYQCQKCGGTLG
jgi:hypothetical protein